MTVEKLQADVDAAMDEITDAFKVYMATVTAIMIRVETSFEACTAPDHIKIAIGVDMGRRMDALK